MIHRIIAALVAFGLAGCQQQSAPETPPAATTGAAEPVATVPYGAWPSPISAESIFGGSRSLHSLAWDSGYLYWVESRPAEGGRNTVMRWQPGGEVEELLAAPWNVRSRVQEYGGRALLVADGNLWFSHLPDQRLYRFRPGEEPVPVTPEAALRYGGCELDAPRERLVCIREDHRPVGEPANTLVALPLAGESEGEVLYGDSDFVSAASLSPDGQRIAFVRWDHPNMPWDNTTLMSAGFSEDGSLAGLAAHNGPGEAVMDAQWDSQNRLHVISDRSNWWQLYRVDGEAFEPIEHALVEAEVGGPAWTFGGHFYRFLPDGRIAATISRWGSEGLYIIDPAKGSAELVELASASIGSILPVEGVIYLVNYSDRQPAQLLATGVGDDRALVIRSASDVAVEPGYVPSYQPVSFTTGGGATAHGIYYPPANPQVSAPPGSAPPLLVEVHGGPTSSTTPRFSLSNLYWTSRGFAILDLNYRGSTGYGRDYRQALYGQWGVADVEDAVAGAQWLAQQGLADPAQLVIRGGSAGGYTTLAALALHDHFAAGASYFGVSDIEALAHETHKYESRYLDQLIGPYPERKDLYIERSPINHLDGFSAPLLLLQGLDDRVVPANQSEMIFEALKSRQVPTAYLPFEGEGHGFRKLENQVRALEAELYFYGQVLGFTPADTIEPIEIVGLKASPAADGG